MTLTYTGPGEGDAGSILWVTYICWRVGASEATSIDELVVSSASGPPFRETWFTLR